MKMQQAELADFSRGKYLNTALLRNDDTTYKKQKGQLSQKKQGIRTKFTAIIDAPYI